jgi:protein gp37
MGATGIEWTRGPNGEPGFTFNPWIGCTAVSDACANCYAETASKKFEVIWGPHGERRGISESTWAAPLAWNRRAEREGRRFRVFVASMADVLDNHRSIDPTWRERLYALIAATSHLDWLMLTKRPENAPKFLPYTWFVKGRWPANVWFGFTAENQEEFDRRYPHAKRMPAPVRFISGEPYLGRILLPADAARFIHLMIGGGESGRLEDCRDTPLDLFRDLRDQCRRLGIPYFQKQLAQISARASFKRFEAFPPDLQVREQPRRAA